MNEIEELAKQFPSLNSRHLQLIAEYVAAVRLTAYAEGFRAGAEAMRATCEKWLSEELGLMEEEIAEFRALPLPEPKP